jgi:hypothetical protein
LVAALLAIVIGTVVLNLWATRTVALSNAYTRQQKQAQSLVVWLVPIVGAVLCLYLANEAQPHSTPSSASEPGPETIAAQYYPPSLSESHSPFDGPGHGDP